MLDIASIPDKLRMNPMKIPQLWNNPPLGGAMFAEVTAVGADATITMKRIRSVNADIARANPPECLGPNQLIAPMVRIMRIAQSAGYCKPR
jgi:hypothetical protein